MGGFLGKYDCLALGNIEVSKDGITEVDRVGSVEGTLDGSRDGSRQGS